MITLRLQSELPTELLTSFSFLPAGAPVVVALQPSSYPASGSPPEEGELVVSAEV